jgi:hypothetical protein
MLRMYVIGISMNIEKKPSYLCGQDIDLCAKR